MVDETTVLLEEYRSLRDEIRLYVSQLLTCFTIFFAFIVALTGFAMTHPEARWAIAFIPVPLLVIGFFVSSRSYTTAILGRRVREIEAQIQAIHSKTLLCWESKYSKKYVYPLLIRIAPYIFILNPIFVTTLLSIIMFILPLVYSLIKSHEFMPGYLYWPYCVLMILMHLYMHIQSLTFFLIGRTCASDE